MIKLKSTPNASLNGWIIDGPTLELIKMGKQEIEFVEKSATEWQPIETAPKDGTLIDLWAYSKVDEGYYRYPECFWNSAQAEQEGEGYWCTIDLYELNKVTHWMPLPDPPERGE